MQPDTNPFLLAFLGGIFASLLTGSAVRIVLLQKASPETATIRRHSLLTWWVLAVLLSGAVLFGLPGAAVLLTAASALGLREYLRLIGVSDIGTPAAVGAFALTALHFALIVAGRFEVACRLTPVVAVVLISGTRVGGGKRTDYIRLTAATVWGMLVLVYAPSFALFLFDLPGLVQPRVGVAGWFLFLVILTEADDIAQAIIGRKFGRHKMVPTISPNKSWEGFVGGLIVTTGLAMVLASWLTTFHSAGSPVRALATSAAAGALITVCGFFGDINMSAVKRDAGVKDGGRLLPGHGGMIDRIDSLTFTAPTFYGFVLLVSV